MCINALEYSVSEVMAIFVVFIQGDPIYRERILICSIFKSPLLLTEDQLMKITEHLVMMVRIKGYWKNLISDAQFSK